MKRRAKKLPPTVLVAGGPESKKDTVTPFFRAALRLVKAKEPRVVQIGAASGDHSVFGRMTIAMWEKAGAAEVVWPKLTGKSKDVAGMRQALKTCDVVFVSGGDVEMGMAVLQKAGLVKDVLAAARRGAVCTGLSAGSIMLGERWIRWPRENAPDAEAETFRCLGIARVSVDCHGETVWEEIRSLVSVRSRETRGTASGYGIPSGAALQVPRNGGRVRVLGRGVQRFQARKGSDAKKLADLKP